jgi:hypothetical protein
MLELGQPYNAKNGKYLIEYILKYLNLINYRYIF